MNYLSFSLVVKIKQNEDETNFLKKERKKKDF